jgi:ABC-type antimicrobial peptide transport system, permease component
MGKFVSKLRIFGSLVKESAMFSISQLKADKFRTFLSLLGIVIGIFSIVAVFSVVSAMRQSIASGFSSFGSDVMYVMQYPILPEDGGEYKWWEYRTRPQVTEEEYKFLKENVSEQSIITAFLDYSKTVKYMRNSFSSTVCAVDKDWEKVSSVNLAKGRYFTEIELENGSAVTILGSAVADALFPNGQNPEGKTIKVAGRDVVVIGTLAPSGSSMVQIMDLDDAIMISYNYSKVMVSPKQTEMTIVAEAAEKEQKDALKNEIRQLMRTRRHLKPMQKDNFSVSELSMLIKEVDGIMGIVNIVGWIIGGFSLLIGGFGIANIMFVSVKERTNQIGVQKALGAQKEFILGEFLFEAVFLSLIGGIVGILLVYVVSLFVPKGVLDIVLTGSNILEGLGISLAVGLISGFLPAKSAADLDPVIAINS